MHRLTAIPILASAWLLLGPSARADLQLTVSQEAISPNSTDLTVGQPVTFDVSLSGREQTQTISFLAATLYFDSSLLGAPSSVTPGDIIPADASSDSFTPTVGVGGEADASYLDVQSSIPITSDGVFFTFTVTPLTNGSGTISFSDSLGNSYVFTSYTLDGIDGSTIDAGPDLSYQIGTSNVAPVPEPSSLLVVLFAGSVVGLCQGRRWLRAGRATRTGGAPSGPVSAPGEAS